MLCRGKPGGSIHVAVQLFPVQAEQAGVRLPIHLLRNPLRRLLCILGMAAIAMVGLSSASFAQATTGESQDIVPLRAVSTPNPNVLPLLLAMYRDHTLPVRLIPVATGDGLAHTFSTGQTDALLSMTYTAAQDVVDHKIPQLQLVQVNFWRGFWILAPESARISRFSQLNRRGLLIFGPTTGDKDGGPDLFFQAALKRANMQPADFKLCYLPVMQAAPLLIKQQPMNSNAACKPSFNKPPTAIAMVAPAASGMVMDSRMSLNRVTLEKAIDMQTLFTGFSA